MFSLYSLGRAVEERYGRWSSPGSMACPLSLAVLCTRYGQPIQY